MDEALDLVDSCDGEAILLAGGTDVVVDINIGKLKPSNIVFLGNIGGISDIYADGEFTYIRAMATHDAAASSSSLVGGLSLLSKASSKVGCPSIRNAGTVGGNVMRASPAADATLALLALDAEARLLSSQNERWVPLRSFFVGSGRTMVQSDEILFEMRISNKIKGYQSCFLKQGRRKAMSLSVVNVAVCGQLKNNVVSDIRIALGAVGPTPMRIERAEAMLEGREISSNVVKEAAEIAAEEIKPISDGRASAWYRREVSRVLVERALRQAFLISETETT